ncbi:MAG TPA: protein kinase [Ktedonobacteraceae bacterium]|nr:protein kinase [Ktedonobacteraceae bacterium]
MTDLVGQQLGNYRLSRVLGQGGFADVYLGEHIHLNTQAAIKVLRTRVTEENAAQFLSEAKIIAHLNHPNIVRVLEFGVENGVPFLVMDYAVNGTLRQRHPKGSQIPLALVAPYVQQAADALQYAHNQRVIHRDLKPENMLLGKRGEVLLSDFGLALTTQSSRYNSTQDIVGTVAYMAPEQLQGKPGVASDQYALGIVVYEWLCGERPFHGSFMEIYSQHMTVAPPSLCVKVPALPIYVEQAVFLALAKNPTDRFQNVRAFANALANARQAMDDSSTDVTVRHAPSLTPPPGSQPAQAPSMPPPVSLPSSANPPVQTPFAIEDLSTRQVAEQSRVPLSGGVTTPPQPPVSRPSDPGMVASPQSPSLHQQPASAAFSGVSVERNTLPSAGDEARKPGKAPRQARRKRGGRLIALTTVLLLIILLAVFAVPRLNLPLPGLGSRPTATSTTGATAGITPQSTPGVTPTTVPDATATATVLANPSPTNTPVSNGTPPPTGQILYQANWSQSLDGWLGSSQWKQVNNGELGSDGSSDGSSPTNSFIIWSPAHLSVANYKIVAQIQFVRSSNGRGQFELGIIARGDGQQSGYEAGQIAGGICDDNDQEAIISRINDAKSRPEVNCLGVNKLVGQNYPVDTNFHTYEFDVTGNSLTLYIDSRLITQTTDNSFIDAGQVGLRDVLGDINVKSFIVYAL